MHSTRATYTDPRRGRITLRELWADFVEAPPVALAPSTLSLYKMQWRVHIEPRLGDRRINSLEPEDIRGFLAELGKANVQAPSINSAHRLLRRLLSLAVKDRRIARNPASGIQAPASVRKEMQFLSRDVVRQIASQVPERYEALVLTLAYAGLRIGEASALRVRNVDLMKRRIAVVEAASEVDGVRIVGDTKTRQNRSVSIPSFLRDMLSVHLAKFSDPKNGEALVFSSEEGTPISQHAFRRTFQRACRRAGIKPIPRVHDLRHSAVAFAIEAGAHPKRIQEMMGHSGITTTLDVYGHLFPTLHEDVSDRLDALFHATEDDASVTGQLAPLRPENSSPARTATTGTS